MMTMSMLLGVPLNKYERLTFLYDAYEHSVLQYRKIFWGPRFIYLRKHLEMRIFFIFKEMVNFQ